MVERATVVGSTFASVRSGSQRVRPRASQRHGYINLLAEGTFDTVRSRGWQRVTGPEYVDCHWEVTMGFRARRSFKVAPGVRLNVSAKSIGVSAGVRGARVSVNSRHGTRTTVGIPGTGISYTSRGGTSTRGSQPAAAAPASRPSKPSLFAPKWEKTLFKQFNQSADVSVLNGIADSVPARAHTARMIELMRIAAPASDVERVRTLLGQLHDEGYDRGNDPFFSKYAPDDNLLVPIAQGITVTLPWDREAQALYLAELEQDAGNLDRAIQIVEGLTPSTVAAVSLADLYISAGRWQLVVELTDSLRNEDEAAMFLLIQRGRALRELGHNDAAREALKEALRPRSRPAELRQLAYLERGKTYLAEAKKGMARKDFERVLAENSAFPGLDELLDATR